MCKSIAEQLRAAVETGDLRKKRLTLGNTGIDKKTATEDAHAAAHGSRRLIRYGAD